MRGLKTRLKHCIGSQFESTVIEYEGAKERKITGVNQNFITANANGKLEFNDGKTYGDHVTIESLMEALGTKESGFNAEFELDKPVPRRLEADEVYQFDKTVKAISKWYKQTLMDPANPFEYFKSGVNTGTVVNNKTVFEPVGPGGIPMHLAVMIPFDATPNSKPDKWQGMLFDVKNTVKTEVEKAVILLRAAITSNVAEADRELIGFPEGEQLQQPPSADTAKLEAKVNKLEGDIAAVAANVDAILAMFQQFDVQQRTAATGSKTQGTKVKETVVQTTTTREVEVPAGQQPPNLQIEEFTGFDAITAAAVTTPAVGAPAAATAAPVAAPPVDDNGETFGGFDDANSAAGGMNL